VNWSFKAQSLGAWMSQSAAPWSTEQRDMGWIVASIARRELRLSIFPCIAASYVILHSFFRHRVGPASCDMCLLLTAALFLACKIEDCFRPLDRIFKEISNGLKTIQCRVPKDRIEYLFGKREYGSCELAESEYGQIGLLEIEFLNALSWNLKIDLPCAYVNDVKSGFSELAGRQSGLEEKFENVLRDLCLVMKNENYLDFSPAVVAAACLSHSFAGMALPEQIVAWIEKFQSANPETFAAVLHVVTTQSCMCVPMG
jgi:hypothetical protein